MIQRATANWRRVPKAGAGYVRETMLQPQQFWLSLRAAGKVKETGNLAGGTGGHEAAPGEPQRLQMGTSAPGGV